MQQNGKSKTLASINKRAFAFLIDDVIVSVLYLSIIWDFLPSSGTFLEISSVINRFMFYLVMIKIFYHTLFVYRYRATLGKMAMKIEILSDDFKTAPNFLQSLNRAVFRVISEIVFYIGFILAFFDKNRQALHDKTAKTVVVNA